MVFFVLRQQSHTIQALIQVAPETVSKHMVKFAENTNPESIVLIEGTIQKPIDLVKSCSVQDVEIKIAKVRIHDRNQGRVTDSLSCSSTSSPRLLRSFPSVSVMLPCRQTRLSPLT